MTINIAACDDNFMYLDGLKSMLVDIARKCEMNAVVKTFANGNNLLREFRNGRPFDIVILDIEMPYIDGKRLAEELRLIDSSFYLIFLTSYKMEIFNTLQFNFKAFIQKKLGDEECEKQLIRILNDYKSKSTHYELFNILKDGLPCTYKIRLCNIVAFYMVDKIIYLKTTTDEFVLQDKIFSKISDMYIEKGFKETYRNYLVNISKVIEIQDNCVVLNNGEKLPLSKRSKKPLLKALSEYVMVEVDE